MKSGSTKPLTSTKGIVLDQLAASVKVIYTDVDGTLVGPGGCFFKNSDSAYTLEPAKALILAHQKNLDVVMVSGRNRLQLREDARLLGTSNYIGELGCQIIYDLGKEVILTADESHYFNQEPCKRIYDDIKDSGAVELLFEAFPGYLEYHTPWSGQRECTHLFRGFINTDEANKALKNSNYQHLKVVDNGVIRRQGALKNLPEIHAYHLLPAFCGKSEAVKKDREIRDIPKESAIAIGDAASDLVLAQQVSAFFLVGNALANDTAVGKELTRFDNIFLVEQEMGLGFAEVINYILLHFPG